MPRKMKIASPAEVKSIKRIGFFKLKIVSWLDPDFKVRRFK